MQDQDNIQDLMEKTDERYEERQEDIADFHQAVQEESETEVIETTCNIVGDVTVGVTAKRNGELMDRMGHIEERLEYVETEKQGTYNITEAAQDAAQLLADVVDDPELTQGEFYKVYRGEGLEELGKMLKTVFSSIEKESERRRGAADGFRSE
jgi:hypothetical protein